MSTVKTSYNRRSFFFVFFPRQALYDYRLGARISRQAPMPRHCSVRPIGFTFSPSLPHGSWGQATRWRVPFPLHYTNKPRYTISVDYLGPASADASHASPTSQPPLAATKRPRCCRQPLSRRPLYNGRCSRRADSPTLLLADTKRPRRRRRPPPPTTTRATYEHRPFQPSLRHLRREHTRLIYRPTAPPPQPTSCSVNHRA